MPSLVCDFFCLSLVCHLFKYHCIALDFCKTKLSPSVLSDLTDRITGHNIAGIG